jgi:hypothetical protein
MSYLQLDRSSSHRHPLLRGGRWHLARPRSRALWTSVTPSELGDLFTDARLRQKLEHLLVLAASVIDVDTLLIFDRDNVKLECAVSMRNGPNQPCAWSWILQSLGDDDDPA